VRFVATLLATLVATSAAAAQTPPAMPPAEELYDRVVAEVNERPIPPYIAFTVDEVVHRQLHTRTTHLRILMRTADEHVYYHQIPDSREDRVDTSPHVVTDRSVIESTIPFATFGLRRRPEKGRGFLEPASTPEPTPPGAPTVIASVHVIDRPYEITSDGLDRVGGRDVYHLKLVPKRDPRHHLLSDLFVDPETFLPRRYGIRFYVGAGPFEKVVPVVCDTSVLGGYLLLTHAHAAATIHLLFLAISGSGSYDIRDVLFPQRLPDWLFDPAEFKAHKNDPVPDSSGTGANP